jgi:hypothetical protein
VFAVAIILALLFTSPALADDASSTPTPLTFGIQAHADASAYSVEAGEQNTTPPFGNQCGGPNPVGVAHTAWYSVRGTGGLITVSTDFNETKYDTAIFVYAGSPTGGLVTCGDDIPGTVRAAVSFPSKEGTTYDIQVGRACNDLQGSSCAVSSDVYASQLAIVANSPVPGTPTPGTPVPGTPGPGGSMPQSVAVRNQLAPSIVGVAVRGRLLTCERGQWASAVPLTYALEWQRDGKAVARGLKYRVAAADVSRRLVCKVTASGPGGSAVAFSEGVTPAATRAETAFVPVRGDITPHHAPPEKACRGVIALTLLKGRKIFGRHTVALKAHCRWSWTFQVSRKKLGNARKLKLKVHFGGNLYLNPVTKYSDILVPRS